MKKYVYLLIFLFGFANISNAVTKKLGVSIAGGVFETSAMEKEGTENSASKSAEGAYAIPSIFLELSNNDKLFVGLDYVPIALESEETEHNQKDKTTSATATSVVNKAQVDFEDLVTLYARIALNDNVYAKAGVMQVEAVTNETLGTGSTYGDETLQGAMLAIGYEADMGGTFARIEANWMEIGGETFTSTNNSDNKVVVEDIEGYGLKLSIGRTF
tara:strand:- start:607 stop:1254 length:648 start_codon:yes stop_codon:yes gene_type:complete